MCGEHGERALSVFAESGSSPHVRGAPDAVCRELRGGGIIPACAGSTMGVRSRQRQGRDHPRMCGEHISSEVAFFNAPGSSPHVRGAQPVVRAEHVVGGIIPACAGSTAGSPGRARSRRDHPRMCGEHWATSPDRWTSTGSSPHVRGALRGLIVYRHHRGIIPACAGSTLVLRCPAAYRRDHPRMCGEHASSVLIRRSV